MFKIKSSRAFHILLNEMPKECNIEIIKKTFWIPSQHNLFVDFKQAYETQCQMTNQQNHQHVPNCQWSPTGRRTLPNSCLCRWYIASVPWSMEGSYWSSVMSITLVNFVNYRQFPYLPEIIHRYCSRIVLDISWYKHTLLV